MQIPRAFLRSHVDLLAGHSGVPSALSIPVNSSLIFFLLQVFFIFC